MKETTNSGSPCQGPAFTSHQLCIQEYSYSYIIQLTFTLQFIVNRSIFKSMILFNSRKVCFNQICNPKFTTRKCQNQDLRPPGLNNFCNTHCLCAVTETKTFTIYTSFSGNTSFPFIGKTIFHRYLLTQAYSTTGDKKLSRFN